MPHHDIVAIGASAGGLAALKRIVAGLPAARWHGRGFACA